ncbi:protein bli-3 protein [Purpureocillium lavendulum]|uniref:Protein bli-3 protein n=1 Tax=Purpureocillium lavendulum TaxID=1247861 RepID=A0AB34FYC0_9HYPO|nr:protein bli-3 protein [Purpureocillium lavendulum]
MSFSNTSVGDKPADPYKKANQDDASLETKVNDLVQFVTSCKFGMMTTREAATGNLVSRCMALAATVMRAKSLSIRSTVLTNTSSIQESGGIDLLFHTNTESGKTDDLTSDPHVNISFLNVSGEWASVSGEATVVTDRDLVKKHYNPALKAWLGDLGDGKHDGSENDPRIGVIRVKMLSTTYSLVAKNIFSRATEVVQGAITGKPAHVNNLREISQDEVKQWRASH